MQKKFTLLVTAFLCSVICFGQFKKGTFTGQLKFDNLVNTRLSTSKGFQKTNFSITPGAGYFIKNNFEIGVGFNYNRNRERFNGVAGFYHQQLNSIGFNVYSNYYLGKGKLKPFVTFLSGWQHAKGFHENETTGSKKNFNFSRFYVGGGLGVNYSISNKVQLFTEATYINKSPFNSNRNQLNVAAGIRIFLNNKKKKH